MKNSSRIGAQLGLFAAIAVMTGSFYILLSGGRDGGQNQAKPENSSVATVEHHHPFKDQVVSSTIVIPH